MARLVDIENNIKKLISEDINNPEIYNQIYDLVYFWLKRNKKMSYDQDAKEVAQMMAEDLYLKAYNGKPVYSWLGYISISYIAYIKAWRKDSRSEIIDAIERPDVAEKLVEMCVSKDTSNSYNTVLSDVYIDQINNVIDNILEDSRIEVFSSKCLNYKASLQLSLQRGKFVSYRLSEGDINYCSMLYKKLYNKIYEDLTVGIKNYTSNLTPLQLFTLESGGVSSDE